MKNLFTELYYFTIKSAWAALYGGLLLATILITQFVDIPFISRYDFIFLSAVAIQAVLLITRLETFEEARVIVLFHIVATVMEIFKTSPAIASWKYPEVDSAIFAIYTVPLFTGFLYSSVGSYISRAWRILKLRYINYPSTKQVAVLSIFIYINFFTHHFIYDLRYVLFAVIAVMFYKTKVEFQVYKKVRQMHFLLSAILTALFIWVAENVGSYSHVWLYPNQAHAFHLVPIGKIGSWFLLLIISFALVSIVHFGFVKKRG